MANIEAGSDDQIIIRDLVESYGLQISSSSGSGNICAVGSLEFIYHRYGYQTHQARMMLPTIFLAILKVLNWVR